MFWLMQPETHIPWMGVLGFIQGLLNIDATMAMGFGSCVMTPGQITWPLSIVWTIAALYILVAVPFTSSHRWYRIGLATGIGTWFTPVLFCLL